MSGLIGTSHSKSKVIGKSQDTIHAWILYEGYDSSPVIKISNNVSSIAYISVGVHDINYLRSAGGTETCVTATVQPNAGFSEYCTVSSETDGQNKFRIYNQKVAHSRDAYGSWKIHAVACGI